MAKANSVTNVARERVLTIGPVLVVRLFDEQWDDEWRWEDKHGQHGGLKAAIKVKQSVNHERIEEQAGWNPEQ